MDTTQPPMLILGSAENDLSLDSPHYGQVNQWIVMQQSNTWRPPTDVFELEDRLIVMVEIAGMRDSEFNVVLQDRRLIISGVRRRVGQDRMAFHQMEVRYGEFRTAISLPWSIERERVAATYKDGFLRVELPRATNQQVHIVNVDVERDEAAKTDER
ncbi:MAG TPA: Hsp20/alpha crystallin family protein [Aggregatilineales bacterium]|nr:Hsp20/alpha crystallin family protein [Anaerolineales bacterium]HRE48581.1 Hsp20/alpha crystallin family protein [Aggregatilineales bacterium]